MRFSTYLGTIATEDTFGTILLGVILAFILYAIIQVTPLVFKIIRLWVINKLVGPSPMMLISRMHEEKKAQIVELTKTKNKLELLRQRPNLKPEHGVRISRMENSIDMMLRMLKEDVG